MELFLYHVLRIFRYVYCHTTQKCWLRKCFSVLSDPHTFITESEILTLHWHTRTSKLNIRIHACLATVGARLVYTNCPFTEHRALSYPGLNKKIIVLFKSTRDVTVTLHPGNVKEEKESPHYDTRLQNECVCKVLFWDCTFLATQAYQHIL